ncbi:hypothetical protein WMY93_009949 [Mugilogobius chulae]|uniref:SET domain-containing protein n=1 Tax=Mugilogobius chulae TaxID=88201 RepID=A0AAW0P6E1_9GOBI
MAELETRMLQRLQQLEKPSPGPSADDADCIMLDALFEDDCFILGERFKTTGSRGTLEPSPFSAEAEDEILSSLLDEKTVDLTAAETSTPNSAAPVDSSVSSLRELSPDLARILQKYIPTRHTNQEKFTSIQMAFVLYKMDTMGVKGWKTDPEENFMPVPWRRPNSHRRTSRGTAVEASVSTPSKRRAMEIAASEMSFLQEQLKENPLQVTKTAQADFRRYCQALLMHQCGLTGRDIAELTVDQWLARTVAAENSTDVRLTAGTRPRIAVLPVSTEQALNTYFKFVRATSVPEQRPDGGDCDRFFLSSSGLPLTNPGADLQRLRERFHTEEPERGRTIKSSTAWGGFCTAFPVGPYSQVPSKASCEAAGFPNHQPFQKRWTREQRAMRELMVLSNATNRRGDRPTPETIQRLPSRETWTSNKPTVADVLKHWVTPTSPEQQTASLTENVVKQTWRGLTVRDLGEKGKVVTAVLPIKAGSPVCDYHGRLLTDAEGKSLDRHEYVFFFKDSEGNRYCVDATDFPCPCHPTMETFGRRMNHSRKNPNVKPRVQDLQFPEGEKTVIVFYALRDISPGEELLWDYGIKESFGGEGADLLWLDC